MFKQLEKYREKAIPDLSVFKKRKKGYRKHLIDSSNKLYSEKYEDIRSHDLSGENFYFKTDNPPYYKKIKGSIPNLLLRTSVIAKLKKINNELKKSGLELFFYDCYRPIEIQNYFHDTWFPSELRKKYPKWNEDQILNEVKKYWAKGAKSSMDVDPKSPPPHSTGAAFDVTIRKIDTGEHLYMGSIIDDVSKVAHSDFFEIKKKKGMLSFSEIEAMKNRRLLYWLMTKYEFASNPSEWWHYSWGDQLWAKLTNQKTAIYSNIFV